jgi:hypothetical protein
MTSITSLPLVGRRGLAGLVAVAAAASFVAISSPARAAKSSSTASTCVKPAGLPPSYPCITTVAAPSVISLVSVGPGSATLVADPGSGYTTKIVTTSGPQKPSDVYLYPSGYVQGFFQSGMTVSNLVPDSTYVVTVARFSFKDPKTGATSLVTSPATSFTFRTAVA